MNQSFLKKVGYYEVYSRNLHGAQKSLLLTISGLKREEFEPIVICPNTGEFTKQVEDLGIEQFIFPLPKSLNHYGRRIPNYGVWKKLSLLPDSLNYTNLLSRFLRQQQIDLIHCNNIRSVLLIGLAARICRIPLIWHLRIDEPADVFQDIGFYLSSCVIVVADAMREIFSPDKRQHDKIVTVYNGVDMGTFSPQCNGAKIQGEFSLGQEGEMTICMVAALTPRKGHIYLIDAIQQLVEQGFRFKALIVGSASNYDADTSYRDQLIQTVNTKNLNEYVIFTGRREDIPEILAASDIFVLPSLSEGFPRSILEAMATGLPVVATDVAGTAELVINGTTGIIVPPRDSIALADALTKLLVDKEQAAKMGQKSRQRIERFFSVEKMISEVERIYRRVL